MDSRRVGLTLGAILLVGVALRLGFVLSQRSDLLFDHPVLDEAEYVKHARSLALGHGEDRPYWQPPGIVYVLAATFEVAGPGLVAPRILQVLASVASLVLVFLIARRLFDDKKALVATAICALHGVLVYECYELLPATWIVLFDLLALWLLLRAVESRSMFDEFGAGLALGVSAIFSPTIVPFAIPAAIVLRKPLSIALFVVGLLLPIIPVTLRNYDHGGEFVPVSTNSGLNLYIGNNADYDTTFAMRPGRHWEELTSEPNQHGATEPGAASAYFRNKAIGFVVDDPLGAIGLGAKKLYLFFNGAEIPRDTDINAASRRSIWLGLLVSGPPLHLPNGLLIPVALLALVVLWDERRRLVLPLAMLATLALVTAAFFITSRHRLPAVPLFAIFAAAGGYEAIKRWRGMTVVLLVMLLNIPTWETKMSYAGELDFYRGLAATDLRERELACAYFRRATNANERDARAWFELGNVLDGREAANAWHRAAQEDPWDLRASRRAAQAFVQLGDVEAAIDTLQKSIDAKARPDADYAPDHVNLAFMLAERDQTAAAIDHLRAAARADIRYTRGAVPGMLEAARANSRIEPAFVQALEEIR